MATSEGSFTNRETEVYVANVCSCVCVRARVCARARVYVCVRAWPEYVMTSVMNGKGSSNNSSQ
jgi:hypothetical protein